MATDFGIDLGTQRTVICAGKSVVLDEYTAISYETHTGELIAAGTDAYNMLGRTPRSITAVCPLKSGIIAEYDLAESMLCAFLKSVANNKMFKARVMVAVPSDITEMPRRSIYNACYAAGARDVCLIETPVAAAIGLGVDFTTPRGVVVVDIGAGTTDIATLSMGGLVQCESSPTAGNAFSAAIERYIKREYNVLIGPHTAERIKKQIGCVIPRPLELTVTSKGRNQFSGMPQTFEINTNEMITALYDTAMTICKAISGVLEKTPPDIVGDIASDGVILTGGGSALFGMASFIENYTGLKVRVADNPKLCVAKGTATAIKNFDLLKNGDYRFKSLDEIIMN